MVIRLFKGELLSILLLQLDKLESLVYSKTLIQEGIDDQINVLLLHVQVLLNIASIYVYTRGERTYITRYCTSTIWIPLTPAPSILATQKQGRPHHCSSPCYQSWTTRIEEALVAGIWHMPSRDLPLPTTLLIATNHSIANNIACTQTSLKSTNPTKPVHKPNKAIAAKRKNSSFNSNLTHFSAYTIHKKTCKSQ